MFALTDIHYFHCRRIVEILKGTEASSKNIFGRYSSQRMKVILFFLFHIVIICQNSQLQPVLLFSQDWQEIVSLYEADNVYLGECITNIRE